MHVPDVVAVKDPEGFGPSQVMTEEKALKKPTGNLMVIVGENNNVLVNVLVVTNDTVALAPVTPGKGLSITSDVVLVVVPVACNIAESDAPVFVPMETRISPEPPLVVICIPVNVIETEVPSNEIGPVLAAVLRLSTFAEMIPVNRTPPNMNASGVPNNGMEEKVIGMSTPCPTVAVDINVMTKGWQEFAPTSD